MKILLIDDDKYFRKIATKQLEDSGHEVVGYEDMPADVGKLLLKESPYVVLLDLFLPARPGTEVLREIKKFDPRIPVVIITAQGNVDMAVQAMQGGAYSFIEKPVDFVRLDTVLKNAAETADMSRKIYEYESVMKTKSGWMGMVGKTPEIKQVFETIQKVADTNASVLITGETGTGKELVAKALHDLSVRDGKLVEIDCGAIPKDLMESELFGHEKGSFTGATDRKIGRVEEARDGTLFLDEICELPPALQVKLLRFLQERYLVRIGSGKKIDVNTRVISATKKNPVDEVNKGNFRDDLFYRLNVVNLHLPPLRERKSDIPLLVEHFLNKYCIENATRPMLTDEAAMKCLVSYSWPGNIRELKNAMESIVVMNRVERLTVDILPPAIRSGAAPIELSSAPATQKPATAADAPTTESDDEILPMEEVKRRACLKALQATGGNVHEAANLLGIGHATLYRQIKKFNIEI